MLYVPPPQAGATPPRGRTYSGRHWTVIRSRGYILRSSVPLLCILTPPHDAASVRGHKNGVIVHTYTLPCEYTGMTRKNAEVTLHRKTYNFEPWTLAYVGTDPTAKP